VIRGGYGVFYDRVPLSVYSFANYPNQVISYGSNGELTSVSGPVPNVIEAETGSRFPLLISRQRPGDFAPYNQTWRIETERSVTKKLNVRLNYQYGKSDDGILVAPQVLNGVQTLALTGGGRSTYRQLEATAKLMLKNGQQMLFSYVHSKAQGDLNRFDSYLSDYPAVPILPNQYSNLPGDTPDRFVSWGILNLPRRFRLAPIFEYRTGRPYAVLDAHRSYVGVPYGDTTRFPGYINLDERLSRDVRFFRQHTVRMSVSVLNSLNHFNALDIHSNIADPQFGTFFGHYKRRYRADFEFLF
jgi:hypothetical protein